MLISKSHYCPYANKEHTNLAYAVYSNGNWCYACNLGTLESDTYYNYKSPPVLKKSSCLYLPEKIISNPKDFSLDILSWLYKYYIFDEDIIKHNIKYIPYEKFKTASGVMWCGSSLLYPVIINDEIVAYQRRFFPNKQIFGKNINKHIMLLSNSISNTIVLTEDYLSAIRLNNNGVSSIPVWGTQASILILNYVLQNYNNILIWFDGDGPGIQASNKLLHRMKDIASQYYFFNSFSEGFFKKCELKTITTELDPKEYSDDEIEKVLGEYL